MNKRKTGNEGVELVAGKGVHKVRLFIAPRGIDTDKLGLIRVDLPVETLEFNESYGCVFSLDRGTSTWVLDYAYIDDIVMVELPLGYLEIIKELQVNFDIYETAVFGIDPASRAEYRLKNPLNARNIIRFILYIRDWDENVDILLGED